MHLGLFRSAVACFREGGLGTAQCRHNESGLDQEEESMPQSYQFLFLLFPVLSQVFSPQVAAVGFRALDENRKFIHQGQNFSTCMAEVCVFVRKREHKRERKRNRERLTVKERLPEEISTSSKLLCKCCRLYQK